MAPSRESPPTCQQLWALCRRTVSCHVYESNRNEIEGASHGGAFRKLALFGLNHDKLLLFGLGGRITGGAPRVQRRPKRQF